LITAKAIQRVAEGGICNSAAAVDLAQISRAAVNLCSKAFAAQLSLQPGGPDAERTFTATDIRNLITNLVGPLDRVCAAVIDIGDGRSIKQAHDDHVAQDAAPGDGAE
jgi:hypothetical protein